MQEIKSRGLTRDAIKMIAMLTMFFNHFQPCFSDSGDISGGIFERNRLFYCAGDVLFSGGGVL